MVYLSEQLTILNDILRVFIIDRLCGNGQEPLGRVFEIFRPIVGEPAFIRGILNFSHRSRVQSEGVLKLFNKANSGEVPHNQVVRDAWICYPDSFEIQGDAVRVFVDIVRDI